MRAPYQKREIMCYYARKPVARPVYYIGLNEINRGKRPTLPPRPSLGIRTHHWALQLEKGNIQRPGTA
jgi:hypothetical protein